MAEIIAAGNTAANSADFTVAAGTPKTLFLSHATQTKMPFGAYVELQIKSTAGLYTQVETLTSEKPWCFIEAPGTYRAVRRVGTLSYAVDLT